MKVWSSEHVFNHKWEQVVEAAMRKYPNPMNPSVVGVDVIDRHINKDSHLISHRLIQTDFGIPSWISSLIGISGKGNVSEHSELDPASKKLSLWSRNLSLSHYLTMDEHLVYSPHPTDSNKTLLVQEAVVTVKGVPLATHMEGAMVGSFPANCDKGRRAIEWLVHELSSGAFSVAEQGLASGIQQQAS